MIWFLVGCLIFGIIIGIGSQMGDHSDVTLDPLVIFWFFR